MEFQFQYGSIKRFFKTLIISLLKLFQFQYGSIKSVINNINNVTNVMFQFQYGSIKSEAQRKLKMIVNGFNSNMVRLKEGSSYTTTLTLARFQFQYGSIKRPDCELTVDVVALVSIPIWFD